MITTKVKWKAIFVSLFFLCLYLFLLYIVIFIAVYITYTYTTDEDDTDSRQELAEKGYTLPEYAFVVECGGVTSGESGVVEVRGWVDIKFNELEYQLLKDYQFYIYSDEWKSDDIQFRNGVLSFKELPFLINKNGI